MGCGTAPRGHPRTSPGQLELQTWSAVQRGSRGSASSFGCQWQQQKLLR
uniref:Alternative protein n=1 Tax=Macrostomum lignano TaxID=282301 RepID=A0A1I8HTI1_9PLAT